MKHFLIFFALFLVANSISAQDSLSMIPREPVVDNRKPINLYEDTLMVLGKSIVNYPMQKK